MKYLIAVDASDNSKFAFHKAMKNFFTDKDHVYILTVAETPSSYPFEDLLNFTTDNYNEMNQKIEQMYSEMLKKYGRMLTKVNVPHTCLIARGTIKDVICRQAQDLLIDVVIMGRRGMGKLERSFIGSTSQYCVHNLNCSVIVIPFTESDKLTPEREEEISNQQGVKEENLEKKDIKVDKGECSDPSCKNVECKTHGAELKQEFRKPLMKSCDNPNCKNEYCTCKPCTCSSAECTDNSCSCKNAECSEKHSKFEKIGQYEREKFQQPQQLDIQSEGNKTKEELKYEGGAGKLERQRVSGGEECNDPNCKSKECLKHAKWQGKVHERKQSDIQSEGKKTKEELKYEGGAGKLERQRVSGEEKECNDPLCNKEECAKHGKRQGKEHLKLECNDPLCNKAECEKHGKLKGKVHEKKVCNDPLCNKAECEKHGKKGVDVNESSFGGNIPGGKSYAAVVESPVKEENIIDTKSSPSSEKKEHKAAINVGAGKIEGKVESKKDDDKWKGSVEVGYKGKGDQGKEYQGKKVEASIETK